MSQLIASDIYCKAILEQGVKKGEQCSRPKLENDYCGKHQKQAVLENGLKDGNKKCKKSRCINIVDLDIDYCDSCKEKKNEILKTLILCKWKESECKDRANNTGYCGRHAPRGTLLDDALSKGIHICDDGKRACKNITEKSKMKCEECLSKNRIIDNKKYKEKSNSLNLCLGCAIEIDDFIVGIKGNRVQRCKECYEKLRETENTRGVRNRNYSSEKRGNLDGYMQTYIITAKERNIAFELSKEQFQDLVLKPCFYCNSYNSSEVIGIDRVNSNKNYTLSNCVPCCKICNFMKGTLSKSIFISQIHKIASRFPTNDSSDSESDLDSKNDIILTSTIPPRKVTDLYLHGKLNEYIEVCVKDNRSPLFIEKLKSIKNNNMTYREFKDFFRLCCKADSKLASSHANLERKRISYKEIYGYFNSSNVGIAIDVYESVHGNMKGFKEDMESISEVWDTLSLNERTARIKTTMIKYQNQRANSS